MNVSDVILCNEDLLINLIHRSKDSYVCLCASTQNAFCNVIFVKIILIIVFYLLFYHAILNVSEKFEFWRRVILKLNLKSQAIKIIISLN